MGIKKNVLQTIFSIIIATSSYLPVLLSGTYGYPKSPSARVRPEVISNTVFGGNAMQREADKPHCEQNSTSKQPSEK